MTVPSLLRLQSPLGTLSFFLHFSEQKFADQSIAADRRESYWVTNLLELDGPQPRGSELAFFWQFQAVKLLDMNLVEKLDS